VNRTLLRLLLSPVLLLVFLLTGEEHPTRPKGARHLLEKYL
jgi:hypothetical protein